MLPNKKSQGWLPSVFNDFFDNNWMSRANSTAPAINIIENDQEYKVEIAAPGMTREDFKIRINEENQLVVTMEHKEEKNEGDDRDGKEEGKYLRREFSYSRFQQAMILPDNIERDKIQAKMQNGVLNIIIPKDAAQIEAKKEKLIDIE